ncbi:glycosyltransferase [Bacillus sp. CGMCC 1.16607]|uniref:glycosyltransferase n=1 Tax=Bacillus sp. CGMCC 1.16607 TaxID=3351842 RepID=UPI00363590B9
MSKILLLGEYSGLHRNLKEGLVELGHEVLVASDGDWNKKINSDIDLTLKSKNKIAKFIRLVKNLRSFKGYDIVQFINPYVSHKFGAFFYNSIFKNNKKIFCLAAGDDVESVKYVLSGKMNKYTPLDEYQMDNQKLEYTNKLDLYLHNKFMRKIDGVIPVMFEYAESYRNSDFSHKMNHTITYPINTDKIQYEKNTLKNKIVFYHASNRPKFKGTGVIKEAMNIFQKKYPNDVEMIYADFLPLNEYLEVLSKTNVVIDQCRSYSYGMNAVYSMAKGKIVMSGSEPEALKELELGNCPVINITPDVNQILNQFENILENKNQMQDMSQASRTFIEETHDYRKIASQYVESWGV